MVEIAAVVGKLRFHLGVGQLVEGRGPEEALLSSEPQGGELEGVLAAQLPIDQEVVVERLARELQVRGVRTNFLHDFLEKTVRQIEVARAELLGEDAERESRRSLVAGIVAGKNEGRGCGRHVVGKGKQRKSCCRGATRQAPAPELVVPDADASLRGL